MDRILEKKPAPQTDAHAGTEDALTENGGLRHYREKIEYGPGVGPL